MVNTGKKEACDDYIAKSIDRERLRQVIQTYLCEKQQDSMATSEPEIWQDKIFPILFIFPLLPELPTFRDR